MVGLLPDMPPGKTKFQTARTRKFRASALSEEDERTISHVEEFGCSVVNVTRTQYGLGWSYNRACFRYLRQTRNHHCRTTTGNRTLCAERGREDATSSGPSHYGPTP